MKALRNSNIELLRFILMTCIILWHIMVHGMNYKLMGHNESIILGNLDLTLLAILVPSVNCFMFISGYFSIKCSYAKLYSFIFQAIFIFILGHIARYIIWNDFELKSLIHIFPIITKQWWFLTEYITIFLLSPIINAGIEKIEKKQFLFIIMSLIILNSFGLYLVRQSLGSNLISLLIIYLIGRYMKIYNINIKRSYCIIGGTISTIILFICLKISSLFDLRVTWLLLSYNNPLIIVQAIVLFYFTISFKPSYNTKINFIGKHCFSIYLITELLGLKLYKYLAYLCDNNVIIVILFIFLIEFICIILDYFQSKINTYMQNSLIYKKLFIH